MALLGSLIINGLFLESDAAFAQARSSNLPLSFDKGATLPLVMTAVQPAGIQLGATELTTPDISLEPLRRGQPRRLASVPVSLQRLELRSTEAAFREAKGSAAAIAAIVCPASPHHHQAETGFLWEQPNSAMPA
jgi:hypothetical protein